MKFLSFQVFTDPLLLETLTDAASRQHAALHNLPQGTAEEYYICACQKLDGYGQEVYTVKNHDGLDTIIGNFYWKEVYLNSIFKYMSH